MKKLLISLVAAAVAVFILIQLVPYGRDHTNPAVVSEPKWDSPKTRQIAKVSCFQCHSNENTWPWYSNVAPASWLIYKDVEEGRLKFNFSDWNNRPTELNELIDNIQSGEMPPVQYTLFHPDAVLTDQQKQDLINGLKATVQ